MVTMYKKVLMSERLPEEGKPVITIDDRDNVMVYKRTEHGWNMPFPDNNGALEYWLEEINSEVIWNEELKSLYKDLRERMEYLEIVRHENPIKEMDIRLEECTLMSTKIGEMLLNGMIKNDK